MGSVYSNDLISQLNLGEGKTLYGDTPLVILKSFLQSGVSYVGGYPGAPTARLIDVISALKFSINTLKVQLSIQRKIANLDCWLQKAAH